MKAKKMESPTLQFLKDHPISRGYNVRPRVVCKDGFSVSIQSSPSHYSTEGQSVEMYDPSPDKTKHGILRSWKSGKHGVYPFVPIKVVDRLIRKHGGLA